jgi:zinc transport system substrate-binding protein
LAVHRILRRNLGFAVLAVTALVAAACGDDDDDAAASGGGDGGDRLSVVASFYPIAEAATRVGGDRVEVTNLTPAGTEPHDLELTPDQVDDIEDADVVLYLGQGFQPAVAEVAEGRDGTSIDLLESIELEAGGSEALEAEEEAGGHGGEGEADEHAEEGEAGGGTDAHADEGATEEEGAADDHGAEGEGEEHAESGLDPHFWLDPQRFVDAVGEIEAALSEASPDDADTFATNADDYEAELTELDQEMEQALSTCERSEIVTSHAAFHYLAERYGLTQLPIAGLSPEAEPDADRLAELTDEIESRGITTVFYETLVSPEVAETLAREADVDTAVLNPIEGLTEEQLDEGQDYASVMRDNLTAITEALGCS